MGSRKLQVSQLRRLMFRLIAKALGEKSGVTSTESDIIAIIRICIVTVYLITNVIIIAGVLRHW